jgi:two-component system, LytTR family, response regulator
MLPRPSYPELRAVIEDDDLSASPTEASLRLVETDGAEPAPDPRVDAPLMEQLLTELRAHRKRKARVAVKTEGKVVFLRADEIDWVEAAGNYVRLHAGGNSFLFRESMKNMEARLDNELFVRIHRSAIVNVERIRELQPWFHGEYVVILQDGTRLMASRVFSDRLDRLIA